MTAAVAEVPKVDTHKLYGSTGRAASGSAVPPPVLYAPSESTVYEIPVDLIVRSETNRQPELDDDFVESIRHGVDSPVLVRPIKATQEHVEQWRRIDSPSVDVGQIIYKLVDGENRWEASKRCGKKTIPAIVRELTDARALEMQVSLNEQRKNYNAMDRAAAYAHLRAQYMKDHQGEKGFTEEKCCDLIAQTCKNDKIAGRTVQQVIALQKLSRECQEALRKGEMEQSHAYEFVRNDRNEKEQLELLKWLRRETLHSQGDIPSVRRLKREIAEMDRIADEQRRQEKLFDDGGKKGAPTTAQLTFDGKTIDLTPGQLPGSVRTPLLKSYPDLSTAYFLKDGRVQLARGLTGKPFYLTVDQLQKLLANGTWIDGMPSAAQTSTAEQKTIEAIKNYKPPTKAQLKAEEERVEQEIQRNLKSQRDARAERKYGDLLFIALAKKAHICSRLLTHVIPGMLFEMWEQGDGAISLEAFAPDVMGWPAPKDGTYSYAEVKEYSEKHTRKFTGNLLSALVITQQMGTLKAEQLAKYFGVDPRKLRQKAAAAVKEEDAAAKLKAKGQKPKAGVPA